MIHSSAETSDSHSHTTFGMNSCSTPQTSNSASAHTKRRLTCAIIAAGRCGGASLSSFFGARHICTSWHCMCHIPNMPHVFCHMASSSVISPVWQHICNSSHPMLPPVESITFSTDLIRPCCFHGESQDNNSSPLTTQSRTGSKIRSLSHLHLAFMSNLF